jgi:hypothetical protein
MCHLFDIENCVLSTQYPYMSLDFCNKQTLFRCTWRLLCGNFRRIQETANGEY